AASWKSAKTKNANRTATDPVDADDARLGLDGFGPYYSEGSNSMIRLSTSGLAVLVLMLGLLVSCSSASAQDMVDNPQYTTWSKQKPESTITYAMNTEAAGQQMTGSVVHKLLE